MRGLKVRRGSVLVALSALVLILGAVPGWAHHKAGHEGGPKKDTGSAVTEDNDGNDGGTPNNVVDEGDNKHPSGKDRSEEHGNSGNQGNSPSDPDGDSNGGPDKPDGSGGVDLADQDGNNGCGNDDDFEDDNNGNCGKKKEKEAKDESTSECAEDATMSEDETCGDDEEVSGSVTGAPTSGEGDTSVTSPVSGGLDTGAEVLGESITRGGTSAADAATLERTGGTVGSTATAPMERPATMAFTGANVLTWLIAGLGLFALGLGFLRFRHTN